MEEEGIGQGESDEERFKKRIRVTYQQVSVLGITGTSGSFMGAFFRA